MKNNTNSDKLSSFLLSASAILWGLSMFFIAIVYDNGALPGAFVLLLGILFGWMNLTFQAYTNITFVIAWLKGSVGKPSRILTTITFFGGLSSFFLTKLQTPNESATIFAPIDAWGWGAIFWISAYALLMLHAFYLSAPHNRRLIIVLTKIVPAIWIGIFIIGTIQYERANAEEKQRVFMSLSIKDAYETIKKRGDLNVFIPFMTIRPAIARPLSGLPYTPLDKELLHSNSLIEFKGKITDRVGCCSTELDSLGVNLPERYIYQNKYFVDYYRFTLSKLSQKQPDYTISVYPAGENKGMQIYDINAQKFIWQAPIRKTEREHGYSHVYYPNYNFSKFFEPLNNGHLHLAQDQTLLLSRLKVSTKPSKEENVFHYEVILPNKQRMWIDVEDEVSIKLYANTHYLLLIRDGHNITLIDRETYASTEEMSIRTEKTDNDLKATTILLEKIGETEIGRRKAQQFKLTFQGEKSDSFEIEE